MSNSQLTDALQIVANLAQMIRGVTAAIVAKQPERIEAIVPRTLRTTLERHAAEAAAAMKFDDHEGD